MIQLAKRVENEYVGVSCGKLDQSCEVLCRKDHLLYLDTRDDTYELIPTVPSMKPYKIAIFFSGLERSLVGSKYNMRQDECKAAAYALQAFSGQEYGKFADTRLRDVPVEILESMRNNCRRTGEREQSTIMRKLREQKQVQRHGAGEILRSMVSLYLRVAIVASIITKADHQN